MPLTHVILRDERLSLAEVREKVGSRSDRLPYTPELLEAMLATRQERDYVSTTSLTAKCLRQQSICRQFDYTESLDAMWASFRGTMFHGQLEKHVQTDAFEEARFFVTVNVNGEDLQLSGSPDLVTKSGLLYDYKFTKENPRWDTPWKDHIEQDNINRWLVDHADRVQWRGWEFYSEASGKAPLALDEERGFIGDIRTAEDFRPYEWQGLYIVYMDDKGAKPLLCTKSIDIPKVSGEGTKKARVADVWDDEVVETLVLERYAAAHEALTLLNIPSAPEGWQHQSHVLCGYCPVRAECAGLEREGQ